MPNIIITILILIVQEGVTLNALFFEVHKSHTPVWFITVLFILTTILDISIGYFAALLIKKHWPHGKIVAKAHQLANKFHSSLGKHGKWVALFLLGNFSFPYINGFVAAWLGFSFLETLIVMLLGNMLWYVTCWLLVLGLVAAIPNAQYAFIGVIIVSFLLIFGIQKAISHFAKK